MPDERIEQLVQLFAPYYEGPRPSTVTRQHLDRLREHEQAYSYTETVTRQAFTCATCEQRWRLRAARVTPDGRLVCPACHHRDHGTYESTVEWCPGCQQSRPRKEFEIPTLVTRLTRLLCSTCRAQTTPPDRTRPCVECGASFTPARSHARYCSVRCRVAAHRARAT